MNYNELNDIKNNYNKYCKKTICNNSSNFMKNYSALSILIVSSSIVSITTLLNPKSRKVLFSTFNYLSKQQLKLFSGIGILAIATYISRKSAD